MVRSKILNCSHGFDFKDSKKFWSNQVERTYEAVFPRRKKKGGTTKGKTVTLWGTGNGVRVSFCVRFHWLRGLQRPTTDNAIVGWHVSVSRSHDEQWWSRWDGDVPTYVEGCYWWSCLLVRTAMWLYYSTWPPNPRFLFYHLLPNSFPSLIYCQ